MDKQIFLPIGVVVLAISQLLLYLFGVDAITQNAINAGMYIALILGGVSAILTGYGINAGPIPWRAFGGATYFLLAIPMLGSVLVADVSQYATLPEPAFGLIVVIAVTLFVAIAIDIMFDIGYIIQIK